MTKNICPGRSKFIGTAPSNTDGLSLMIRSKSEIGFVPNAA